MIDTPCHESDMCQISENTYCNGVDPDSDLNQHVADSIQKGGHVLDVENGTIHSNIILTYCDNDVTLRALPITCIF